MWDNLFGIFQLCLLMTPGIFFTKTGKENVFYNVLLGRQWKLWLSVERLRRWQKEVKGRNNVVLMDITKLGQLPLIESLLPEEIENRRHFGENPTLRQLYLQSTVFVNTKPQLLFLDIRILWKEKQKSWKVTYCMLKVIIWNISNIGGINYSNISIN